MSAVIATTKLIAFRRINASKANARLSNFERVAIDYAGLSREIVRERGRGTKAGRRDKQRRDREISECHVERPKPFFANVLMLCKRICSA